MRRLLLLLGLLTAPLQAAALPIPEPLAPWREWVLHGHETQACPFFHQEAAERQCAWPSRLELDLTATGGRFTQQWQLYAPADLPLPGGSGQWPQEVRADGQPAVVLERDGRPVVRLAAGSHRIEGRLLWQRLPELVRLPPATALIEVQVAGVRLPSPRLEGEGLWLQERAEAPAAAEERLELRVFRRIEDSVPLRLTTHLELEVAGRPREVVVGPVMTGPEQPLALRTPLPARLEADGRLRLQVRPGLHTVDLVTRLPPAPEQRLTRPAAAPPWPEEEVWVFAAHPELRRVEVTGAVPVDPNLTPLPAEWRRLPGFLVPAGGGLELRQQQRGDDHPDADHLRLDRRLLLDFDGEGFTIEDRIQGTLARSGRLEAAAPISLGRATVGGDERLITRPPAGAGSGIEVGAGALQLSAISRLAGGIDSLPAAGWNREFEAMRLSLALPPGWSLLSARGPNHLVASAFARWSLMDLFLVMLVSAALKRLWGWRAALLGAAALGLSWHEPGAPQWIIIYLLALAALLRVLPEGWPRRLAVGLRGAGWAVLALILLPFLIAQARSALYPQLDPHISWWSDRAAPLMAQHKAEEARYPQEESISDSLANLSAVPVAPPAPRPLRAYDPEARIQTGPGLPEWHGRTILLPWSGPVGPEDRLALTLLPPWANRLLALARVALLLGLALLVSGVAWHRLRPPPGAAAAAIALLAAVSLPAPEAAAADFPPPELLTTLEQRLGEPPPCLPGCAAISRLHVSADDNGLLLDLELHAAEAVAVPLPASAGQWLPARVELDGATAAALARDPQGQLLLAVAPGVHRVRLAGPLPSRPELALPLALRPAHAEARTSGWSLEGVLPDGSSESQLVLRRERRAESRPEAPLESGPFPPFVQVERHLDLGLNWSVETRVVRLSPASEGIALRVPLLPGESVTDPGVQVQAGQVQLHLGAGQERVSWHSALERRDLLELTAAATHDWVEVWRLTLSPLWHLDADGLAPVKRPADGGPAEWRPWPGETLALRISRPEAVPGPTLTWERVALRQSPGNELTTAQLTATVRSSRGGPHLIRLPATAQPEQLKLNGVPQPLRTDSGEITVNLLPAEQQLELSWRERRGSALRFTTSTVDLGAAGVNASLTLALPHDRWLLFTSGPRLGPVVLFWGGVLLIALLAAGLGRYPLTPLRSRDWFLLGLGLFQASPWLAIPVIAWLLALSGRRQLAQSAYRRRFNTAQLLLPLVTLAALLALFGAVHEGLLGHPEMQVAGNGSSQFQLAWYQDRFSGTLPTAEAITLPLWVYRVLMLAWALWLATALLRWLRWGWECYSSGGLWRPRPPRLKRSDQVVLSTG